MWKVRVPTRAKQVLRLRGTGWHAHQPDVHPLANAKTGNTTSAAQWSHATALRLLNCRVIAGGTKPVLRIGTPVTGRVRCTCPELALGLGVIKLQLCEVGLPPAIAAALSGG
jgi:hypothetical protein